MMSSLLTNLPTEIIYIPFFELMENLSTEEIEQVKRNVSIHPSNIELLNTYVENLCWVDFKNKMSEITRNEKKTSKLSVINQPFRMNTGSDKAAKKAVNISMLTQLTGVVTNQYLEKREKNKSERRLFQKRLKLPKIKVKREVKTSFEKELSELEKIDSFRGAKRKKSLKTLYRSAGRYASSRSSLGYALPVSLHKPSRTHRRVRSKGNLLALPSKI